MEKTIDFRHLRAENFTPRTFGEDLFPARLWTLLDRKQESPISSVLTSLKEIEVNEKDMDRGFELESTSSEPAVRPSEKKSILSSFEKFVNESGDESDTGVEVKFPGGRVVQSGELSEKIIDLDKLELGHQDDINYFDKFNVDTTQVVFICEKPKDVSDDNPGQDLLSKMIAAMKIPEGHFTRVFIEKNEHAEKSCALLMKDLMASRNLTVVTMGAYTTNAFTRKKDRLSKIHGKLSEYSFVSQEVTCAVSHFPVFHPDLLTINPNMKRSAWIDLQKVMKHIGLA